MTKEELVQQLEAYRAWDANESAAQRETIAFLRHTTQPFARNNPIGHVTGSAWLVDFYEKNFLLVFHRKIGVWLQCGGHAETETDPLEIALRETREESGIESIVPLKKEIFDIGVHRFTGRGKYPAHNHYDIRYLLKVVKPDVAPKLSHESMAIRWFSVAPSPQQPQFLGRLYAKWMTYHSAS